MTSMINLNVSTLLYDDIGESLFMYFVPLIAFAMFFALISALRVMSTYSYEPTLIRTEGSRAYISQDVTVITVVNREQDLIAFATALDSWATCSPKEIIVNTSPMLYSKVLSITEASNTANTHVLCSSDANGLSGQLNDMLNQALSPLIVITDSNSIWKQSFLDSMVTPFERSDIKATCTSFEAPAKTSLVHSIADMILSAQNAEFKASSSFDGGVQYLSGLATVYRREELQSSELHNQLRTATNINTSKDIDIFLWTFFMSHNNTIAYQSIEQARFTLPIANLLDVLRYKTSSTKRVVLFSLQALFRDGFAWTRYPWIASRMLLRLLRPLALLYFGFVVTYLALTIPSFNWELVLIITASWSLLSTIVTMLSTWSYNIRNIVLFLPIYVFVDTIALVIETLLIVSMMVMLPFRNSSTSSSSSSKSSMNAISLNESAIITSSAPQASDSVAFTMNENVRTKSIQVMSETVEEKDSPQTSQVETAIYVADITKLKAPKQVMNDTSSFQLQTSNKSVVRNTNRNGDVLSLEQAIAPTATAA